MSGQARDPALSALESKLTSLTPLPSSVDRDYLLYHAGRASVRGTGWFWPSATGLLFVVTVGLSFALLYRPVQLLDPVIQVRTVYVPALPPPPVSGLTRPSDSYYSAPDASVDDHEREQSDNLRFREQVFRFGVEALPPSRPSAAAEKPLPMDPLIGLPASTLDDGAGRQLLGRSLQSSY
jgi:hypothetical protein